MFSLVGIKTVLISAAVALAVGGFGGWKARDALCDAAKAKAEVASLQRAVAARDEAMKRDSETIKTQAADRERLEGAIHDLENRISAGECLSADDADRLRKLWRR